MYSGSPPIVPQTLTSIPCLRPPRPPSRSGGARPDRRRCTGRRRSRWSGRRPGCTGSGRWFRSRRNPPPLPDDRPCTAAAGTSTMMPTGRSARDRTPLGGQLGGDVVEDGPRLAEFGQRRDQREQDPDVAQACWPGGSPGAGSGTAPGREARAAGSAAPGPGWARRSPRVGRTASLSAPRSSVRIVTGRPCERPDHGGVGLELLFLAGRCARRSGTGTRCGRARRRRPRAPGRRRPRRGTRYCPRGRRGRRRAFRPGGRPGRRGPGTARPARRRPCGSVPGSAQSGSRMTRPSSPSMMTVRTVAGPVQEPARARPRPGSRARRRRSPYGWRGPRPRWRSPSTRCGSSPAVSLGERSCASSTVGVEQLVLRARPGPLADQVAEDPLLDVADIGGAGGQVRIGQPLRGGRRGLEHLDDGVLGGDRVVLDPGCGRRGGGSGRRSSGRGPPGCRRTADRAAGVPRPRRPRPRPWAARGRGRAARVRRRPPRRRSSGAGAAGRAGRGPRGPIAIPGLTAIPRRICIGSECCGPGGRVAGLQFVGTRPAGSASELAAGSPGRSAARPRDSESAVSRALHAEAPVALVILVELGRDQSASASMASAASGPRASSSSRVPHSAARSQVENALAVDTHCRCSGPGSRTGTARASFTNLSAGRRCRPKTVGDLDLATGDGRVVAHRRLDRPGHERPRVADQRTDGLGPFVSLMFPFTASATR